MNGTTKGTKLTVITQTADILGDPREPSRISNKDSQLLYGEQFEFIESHGLYIFGKSVLDGYEGYVERDQLVKDATINNVMVKVRSTHIYPEPNFKSRPKHAVSFLSRITVLNHSEGDFTQLEDGDWVFTKHIADIRGFKLSDDLAETATSIFLNSPYRYGGRCPRGVDCSALLQLSMIANGHPCPPRDSCDQIKSIGYVIPRDSLQRGDIVFFEGHVVIMIDQDNAINATSRHMMVVIEKLSELEKIYGKPLALKRL